MAKQEAKTAVPRLRFPEFRDSREWVAKSLKEICTVNPSNDGLPSSFVYIDLESVEDGLLKSKNRIDRESAPSRAQRLLRDGDVIFQVVRPYQRNNFFFRIQDGDAYVASTGYAQLRANDSESFLYQLIHSDPFVNKVVEKCTGSNYPAINSSDLGEVALFAPEHSAEQQKIADCLTSLDEVIAAQGRKVDALKAHKRGLMQQLFPREGETRPRLRFPEFRDAPEWEAKRLEDVAPLQRGFDLTSSQIEAGHVPVVYSNGIRSYHNVGMASGPGLVTGRSGTIGSLHFIDKGNYWPHNTSLWVTTFKEHDPKFVYYLYAAIGMERFASGSGVPTLNRNDVHAFETRVPEAKGEQQRIADCLSSIDTQITAESHQLAALKTHKQGLMQQLFPAPEAAA